MHYWNNVHKYACTHAHAFGVYTLFEIINDNVFYLIIYVKRIVIINIINVYTLSLIRNACYKLIHNRYYLGNEESVENDLCQLAYIEN